MATYQRGSFNYRSLVCVLLLSSRFLLYLWLDLQTNNSTAVCHRSVITWYLLSVYIPLSLSLCVCARVCGGSELVVSFHTCDGDGAANQEEDDGHHQFTYS